MKKVMLSFILCLLWLITKAQEQPLPAAVSNQLPKGYEVLNNTSGDLNLDTHPDLIVVLNKAGERATSDVALHPGETAPANFYWWSRSHPVAWRPAATMPFTPWIAAA